MSSNLALGLLLAVLVSAGAVKAGALTARAALASTAVGTIVFGAGGVAWSVPLLIFFVSSSLLSRERNSSVAGANFGSQSPRRTARQVLANGSVPALWASCHVLFLANLWSVLFASAVATAAADTWATELGRRSSAPPRDLLTGRRVPVGTSGGVTPVGVAASLAGSTMITVACLLTGMIGLHDAPAVTVAGFGGALLDSLLGATLQERRWCPTCLVEIEDAIHAPCLTPTIYRRGIPGLDNDRVNLSASLAGSVLGFLATHLI